MTHDELLMAEVLRDTVAAVHLSHAELCVLAHQLIKRGLSLPVSTGARDQAVTCRDIAEMYGLKNAGVARAWVHYAGLDPVGTLTTGAHQYDLEEVRHLRSQQTGRWPRD